MIREAFQDLNRVRRFAGIAARYGFADLLRRSGLGSLLGQKVETSPQAAAQSVARRFRLMLSELGPTFVKLGQVLSTRGDLLPAAFIDELSLLQDQAPPVSMAEVKATLEAELGQPLDALFREFDEVPLAAASIAQVHRAVTQDGREVAVKVQRAQVEEQIRADLTVLHSLARALEAVVEEMGVYPPTVIVEEFDKAIHEELDFLNEASNIRAFRKSFEGDVHTRIPQVHDDLTTRRVLTMEFIRAPKLSQAMQGLSEPERKELAEAMLSGGFKQLFEHGLFHGDPHPGNLLVLPGPVLAIIDLGLVGRLTRQMQETLISLVIALALKDGETVARLLYRLGTPDSRANLRAFKADVDQLLSAYLPASLKDINTRSLLRELLDLAVKYRIRVPREYAILARSAVTTEGVVRSLYPELAIADVFLPHAQSLIAERYDPTQLQGGFMKTLLRLQNTADELPMQLSQILLDLETGKFTLTVKSDQLVALNESLRSLAVVAFVGLTACGFIIGTFISFAGSPWKVGGVPVLGLLGIGATVFLFSTALARQILGNLRKLSLRRLLGPPRKRP